MKASFLSVFAAAALLLAAEGAQATPANVTVGPNGADSFSPANVTINKGETVTFTWAGSQFTAHNVIANDNSFRCAQGCDDTGGNGNFTGQAWTFTRTFNTAGVINYHCQFHGLMMSGSITVNDTAPPPPQQQNIVSGMSGNWDDPSPNQGGHGFQFEILPNNGMLAIWFVFNPTGTGQTWIFSQGGYDPNSNDVVLPAYLETGGTFPPNFDGSKLVVTAIGILEFKFTECGKGTVQFTPNAAGDGLGYHILAPFPIQQVTKIDGTACP